MFGYITPCKDELKIKEYNVFKAYYCGLCRCLGDTFNPLVRGGLSFDFVFLYILTASLHSDTECTTGRCVVNPFKKKDFAKGRNAVEYSAYISIILTYFKLLDDLRDKKSPLALICILPYLGAMQKVKKKYGVKYLLIKEHLKNLSDLEKQQCDILDKSAHEFGQVMEVVFDIPFEENPKTLKILKWLGYNIGRWLYTIDALDDIEQDIKTGCYNPILMEYKCTSRQYLTGQLETVLYLNLDSIAKSFELLDIKSNKSILHNIFYLGMKNKTQKILKSKSCNTD